MTGRPWKAGFRRQGLPGPVATGGSRSGGSPLLDEEGRLRWERAFPDATFVPEGGTHPQGDGGGQRLPLGVLEQGEAGRGSGVRAGRPRTRPREVVADLPFGEGCEPGASHPERPGPAGEEAGPCGLPAADLRLAPVGGRIYLAC
jgi:hypothetical protein